jgi:membrane peptidoglycan carboxypeptidase
MTCAVVAIFVFLGIWLSGHGSQSHTEPSNVSQQDDQRLDMYARIDLQPAINGLAKDSAKLAEPIILNADGRRYFISTGIYSKLQKYIFKTLKRSRTQQSAVVVMNPQDGRLLSMVNYDANGHSDNLCLQANFPAASLFKIVTAAAALEGANLSLDQSLYYRGS